MPPILVFGEALVDLVPVDRQPMAALKPVIGGGPFNVAVTAARLGGMVGLATQVSTDAFGEAIMQRLQEEHVVCDAISRSDELTSLAVTSIVDDGSARYSFYVEGTADRSYTPPELTVTPRVAVFGTLSLALEPGASRLVDMARSLADAGAFIALDPNIRAISRTHSHRARLLGLLSKVSLLKLSDEERPFFGDKVLRGLPIVVTTRGADGIHVKTEKVDVTVPAPKITVADTIGAGDTVMGALVLACDYLLDAGINPRDMDADGWRIVASLAAHASALTCTKPGAQPPHREELAELITQFETYVAALTS